MEFLTFIEGLDSGHNSGCNLGFVVFELEPTSRLELTHSNVVFEISHDLTWFSIRLRNYFGLNSGKKCVGCFINSLNSYYLCALIRLQ